MIWKYSRSYFCSAPILPRPSRLSVDTHTSVGDARARVCADRDARRQTADAARDARWSTTRRFAAMRTTTMRTKMRTRTFHQRRTRRRTRTASLGRRTPRDDRVPSRPVAAVRPRLHPWSAATMLRHGCGYHCHCDYRSHCDYRCHCGCRCRYQYQRPVGAQ